MMIGARLGVVLCCVIALPSCEAPPDPCPAGFALVAVDSSPYVPDHEIVHPKTGIRLRYIRPGTFTMGNRGGGDCCPAHPRRIERPFYIGVHEVSVEQWHRGSGGNGELDAAVKDLPMVGMTQDEAEEFCAAIGGRLPTEAEWEYCCRAGTVTRFSWGDRRSDARKYSNCLPRPVNGSQDEGKPINVMSLLPNAWGLWDMSGNVSEFCSDGFSCNYGVEEHGGQDALSNQGLVVVRGGNFTRGLDEATSYWRTFSVQGEGGAIIGFRVVVDALEAPVLSEN
jgi:formylglycine-generating enzyme required for sulfatase activity